MSKVKLTCILDFGDNDFCAYSNDESEREWFREHLMKDELILHSNLIGSEIGSIEVLGIEYIDKR